MDYFRLLGLLAVAMMSSVSTKSGKIFQLFKYLMILRASQFLACEIFVESSQYSIQDLWKNIFDIPNNSPIFFSSFWPNSYFIWRTLSINPLQYRWGTPQKGGGRLPIFLIREAGGAPLVSPPWLSNSLATAQAQIGHFLSRQLVFAKSC